MRLPFTDISRLIREALGIHSRKSPLDHPAGSIRDYHFGKALPLPRYTDATRPSAAEVGAGAAIYNSDDYGINVSDGTDWRAPSGGWVVT
jgi:hypothetical protein